MPTTPPSGALTVVVASENPVKQRATAEAVRAALQPTDVELTAVDVPSGVAAQPTSDAETLRGARNRADAAYRTIPDADLWVGIEGGTAERDGALECMAWVVVLGRVPSSDGADAPTLHRAESRTATYTLPTELATLIRAGVELGDATDQVFAATDSKRGTGTVGPLTGGVIDRVAYYAHAVVLALVPFRNEALTFESDALGFTDSAPASVR